MMMNDLKNIIQELMNDASLSKVTLSKPKVKSQALKNIFIRPIADGDMISYQCILRSATKDVTQMVSQTDISNKVLEWLSENFYNVTWLTAVQQINLQTNKKGNFHITRNQVKITTKQKTAHDHQKSRLIESSKTFLQDLGITSTNGLVYDHSQKKYKQINRYVELISHLIKPQTHKAFKVLDMGSGKGYLTFALYDFLTEQLELPTQVKGIELRSDLVNLCNTIASKNNMQGLTFEEGNIGTYKQQEPVDMVVALHACDVATDMAIIQALEAKANYIVMAPCCHKQVRKSMELPSQLKPMLQHGILAERQAEMLTDAIRGLYLEAEGYEVKIFEFISIEHTGKNVMITASKTRKPNPNALKDIAILKTQFGIKEHYLDHYFTTK